MVQPGQDWDGYNDTGPLGLPDLGAHPCQDDDRRHPRACAVSGRRPRACRSARRTGAGHVRHHVLIDRIRQGRQASRAGGDHRDTLAGVAGYPVRDEHLVIESPDNARLRAPGLPASSAVLAAALASAAAFSALAFASVAAFSAVFEHLPNLCRDVFAPFLRRRLELR
jgi:hypothetical protein